MRSLTQIELTLVGGGDGVVDTVVGVIQDNLSWIGQTIQNGFDGGETNVNNYVIENGNSNWINASNNWLYDTTNDLYAIDTDGDGYFNYAGSWDGCVFSMYDGLTWNHNHNDCEDDLEQGGEEPNEVPGG
jgi:hypothetical protein